jgi:micrococcal nuclease
MGSCIGIQHFFLDRHNLSLAEANNCPKYVPEITKGKVVKVYDGDTITIVGKVRYNPKLYKFSVRLNGLDCPEMKTKNEKEKLIAVKAKDYVESIILNKIIVMKDVKLDKYGRLLAYVYLGKRCINNELLEKNLAVSYDGGTKHAPHDWEEYWKKKN